MSEGLNYILPDEDDNKMEELGWSGDWPNRVDVKFLKDEGFRIEKENNSCTETDKILSNLKFGTIVRNEWAGDSNLQKNINDRCNGNRYSYYLLADDLN